FPHVAQISFFNDPADRHPVALLDAWPTLVAVAEAACAAGVRVSVIQASTHSQELTRNGVDYYFLPFGAATPMAGAAEPLGTLFRRLSPNVIHVHGLGFPRHVLDLAQVAPGIPIVLQDHADRPPRIWRRALWRRAISRAAAITFCSAEQARPFQAVGLISSGARLYAIPESTSRFTPGDREQARQLTGIAGDPAILWVGHLNANKDPLTMLAGISVAARTLPGLKVWCCFGSAPLEAEVRRHIEGDPLLTDRVHLLGKVPHAAVERLMRAADLFVLGSHHESTGYSVIEALACGLPPLITDIPSFRSLTAGGEVGMLWQPGDSRAFCDALQLIAGRLGPGMRAGARLHFERELSLSALGSKLAEMYRDQLQIAGGKQDLQAWPAHEGGLGP